MVSTPIGNLEDITLRALRVLREEVALIACEDTRQSQKLLDHYQIRKPLISYHDHNEATRATDILEALGRGQSVALISDAGTPLVSDPGYRVVTAAIEAGFSVIPLPGPSAALAALAASGLPTDHFRFIGFLPPKTGARQKLLDELAHETATIIAFESPHRILETLQTMSESLGQRPLVLARELTKIHEEFLRGSPASILETLERRGSVKGEITLVIGRGEAHTPVENPLEEIQKLQNELGLDRMEAIKTVAKRMGLPKREIYRLTKSQNPLKPRT